MNWATSTYGAGTQAQVVGPQKGPLRAGVENPATANVAVTRTVKNHRLPEPDAVVHEWTGGLRCGRT